VIQRFIKALIPVCGSVFLISCGAGASGSADANGVGSSKDPSATALGSNGGAAGSTCKTDDPNHICLALKYVAFNDSKGNPTVSSDKAVANVKEINKLYDQCNVGFQIDNYVAADPNASGLTYNTADTGELTDIRKNFVDDSTLLVVTTGDWDRSGSLGNTGANAWTSMPGETPYGAVLEKPVATFGNIIAHEIGHYLDLPHESDESNLMNPVIYDSSTQLSKSQCSTVREAANSYWQKMIR
jgi:hypothetical protein